MTTLPNWLRNTLIVLAIGLSFGLGALIFSGGAPSSTEEASSAGAYTCSMHPNVRQDEPGDCPICGMELIPVRSFDAGPAATDAVVLSERAKALARIRTTEVRRHSDPTVELRLLGRIEADETARRTVTAWTSGRIERLHVNATGQTVRRGQIIATLYSPELYAAHQDLLTAHAQLARASESGQASARAALQSTRARLRLLGVPDDELARMEGGSEPATRVPIRTPFAGTVLDRLVTEGEYVQTGAPLYRVADLSRLWVQLDAYERDLSSLAVGQAVTLELEGATDAPIEGTVAFIDPTVDPATRTAQVRVEITDDSGRLRPGMITRAIVLAPAGPDQLAPLVIPASAPLFTGKRSLVYVEQPDAEQPTYVARSVRLGPRTGEVYPVVSGLSEGERVVTRGAFALDADLQIQGGDGMMSRGDDRDIAPSSDEIALSDDDRARLAEVVRAYLRVQAALADDKLDPARQAARDLGNAAAAVTLTGRAEVAWRPIARALDEPATRIGEATSLEQTRAPFEPLSDALRALLRTFGNPVDQPLRVAFCPMASGSRGAEWIQEGDEVDNAYFGHRMRRCGEVRETVPPGEHLGAEAK